MEDHHSTANGVTANNSFKPIPISGSAQFGRQGPREASWNRRRNRSALLSKYCCLPHSFLAQQRFSLDSSTSHFTGLIGICSTRQAATSTSKTWACTTSKMAFSLFQHWPFCSFLYFLALHLGFAIAQHLARQAGPNNSFKPKLFRYIKHMAG